MESFSLVLQLRAANEIVRKDFPLRAFATWVTLVCDVMSALLLIQLGQFSHVAFSTLPLLISAASALDRHNYKDSRTENRILDPRGILQSILVPNNFSTFGLCPRQKPATRTVLVSMLNRIVCFIILLVILENRDCTTGDVYVCECFAHAHSLVNFDDVVWKRRNNHWSCDRQAALWRADKQFDSFLSHQAFSFISLTEHPFEKRYQAVFRGAEIGPLCDSGNLVVTDTRYNGTHEWPGRLLPSSSCSVKGGLPAMLDQSCQDGEFDSVKFQECRHKYPLFTGLCDGQFTVCGALAGEVNEEKVRVLVYLFLPMSALLGIICGHGLTHLLGCSLLDVQENKVLRKQVKKQAKLYEDQMKNGDLQHSLLFGRMALGFKLGFFIVDIIMDVVCLSNFVRSGFWHFAGCQLAILIVSSFLQLRRTKCTHLRQMILQSWNAGMACNPLQHILLEEKTFEAPLSLFMQFFSAFYMAGDDRAFTSLWFSMMLSSIGVATGLYTWNHLAVVDLADEEEDKNPEVVGVSAFPSFPPTVMGQPQLLPPPPVTPSFPPTSSKPHALPPPPGMTPNLTSTAISPSQVLPPPPGMGLDFPRPASKRPGQFASATE